MELELLRFLSATGDVIIEMIALSVLLCMFGSRWVWTCGLCGKTNVSGFLKFLFCMCDHMPRS